MGFASVLSFAHQLVASNVRPGEPVIDATAGRGNDTLFLAKHVGPRGTVYAFDIQQDALDQTDNRLRRNSIDVSSGCVRLHLCSHHLMNDVIEPRDCGKIGAAMFNLGYLPEGDQRLITTSTTTIVALQATLGLLRSGGVVTIVLYPGHQDGDVEAADVERWATQLDKVLYQSLIYRFLNGATQAPYLISLIKR